MKGKEKSGGKGDLVWWEKSIVKRGNETGVRPRMDSLVELGSTIDWVKERERRVFSLVRCREV